MLDIRQDWAEVARRMRTARALGLLISLEDALRNPADRVSPATLSQEGREKLQGLTELERVTLALHSCEKLDDLIAEVQVPGVWYVANRGFEFRDPQGKDTRFFGPEDVRLLEGIHEELLLQTGHVAGVRLLHRGPCLVLDYAEVDPPQVPVILDLFRNVLRPFASQIAAVHTRRTIEARIRSVFDERTALRFVHRRFIPGTLFFYFGADSALLKMFEEFHPPGICVEVGAKQDSVVKYSLASSSEVVEVLGLVTRQWKGAGDS